MTDSDPASGGDLRVQRHGLRRIHSFVTLIEKLDATSRRWWRRDVAAPSFVRHYEDAARIITRADMW